MVVPARGVVSFVGVLVASLIAASGVDHQDPRNSGLLGHPCMASQLEACCNRTHGSCCCADLKRSRGRKR